MKRKDGGIAMVDKLQKIGIGVEISYKIADAMLAERRKDYEQEGGA